LLRPGRLQRDGEHAGPAAVRPAGTAQVRPGYGPTHPVEPAAYVPPPGCAGEADRLMVRIEDLSAAAANAGLLVQAEVGGQIAMVDFRAPDETVLDGLALSPDYLMRFPASALPDLAVGQVVTIG